MTYFLNRQGFTPIISNADYDKLYYHQNQSKTITTQTETIALSNTHA